MVSCCRYAGKRLRYWSYGSTATGLSVEEVGVPDGQQAQQDRQILCQRRGTEVLVHGVEAGEHLAELRPGRSAIMVDRPMAESIE